MSKVYNSALQARVEQFLQDRQISQAKAAPLMGISQTALSQYRRSMYDNGDISALESKLEEFFKAQDEQDASTEKALPYKPIQDYIPTSISEDVYKLIRYWAIGRLCAELIFFVICTRCGCRTGFFEKPSYAAAAWNRRSPGKELAIWHPKSKNA